VRVPDFSSQAWRDIAMHCAHENPKSPLMPNAASMENDTQGVQK
jgi:hypothetical protein